MGNSLRRHKEFGVEIRKRRTLVTTGSLRMDFNRPSRWTGLMKAHARIKKLRRCGAEGWCVQDRTINRDIQW
jgi:hypothetical protein